MTMKYKVTLYHSHAPELNGAFIFTVDSNSDGKGGTVYYATAPRMGCGKDAPTPLAAIARLYRDHACTLVAVEPMAEGV